MRLHGCILILLMGLAPSKALSSEFTPFSTTAKHPFVGQAAHVPGEGPQIVLPKPLNAPSDIHVHQGGHKAVRLTSNPLYLAALFYRNYLTKVDGPRCGHYPTCSHFANQAVARHGVVGILMGLERIIRTGRSSMIRWLPEIGQGYKRRYFDPIENYEIWNGEKFTGFQPQRKEKPLVLEPLTSVRTRP